MLSGLSFAVPARTALVLTGPNGAGKTTLIRAIAGFLKPVRGTIALEGGQPEQTLGEQCHYVAHANGIKAAFTVGENLAFWQQYFGGAKDGAILNEAAERLGLGALTAIPAAYLSAGQRRRLALARLLVAPRPVWLLDEPTVSLDAASRALLRDLIERHLAAGGLVVAATHDALGIAATSELRLVDTVAAS